MKKFSLFLESSKLCELEDEWALKVEGEAAPGDVSWERGKVSYLNDQRARPPTNGNTVGTASVCA